MYIADSGKKIWLRYRMKPDGSILPTTVRRGGPVGIRVDKEGNLYGAVPGGVWIISPQGKHLGTIKVPERVSNVTWGDQDGMTLYITASTSVYRIKLKVPGMRN